MATLQTADGRLLRSQRPAGASLGPVVQGSFPPMWSMASGARMALTDGAAGVLSYERIYRSQPVVATAVDKLTRRIATLPFDAFKRTANDGRELDRGRALATLIRQAVAARRVRSIWLAFIAQSLLVHGNALVAKLRALTVRRPRSCCGRWIGRRSTRGRLSAAASSGGRRSSSITRNDSSRRGHDAFRVAVPSGSEVGVSPLEKLGTTSRLIRRRRRISLSRCRAGTGRVWR
jgi:phage portal protein BeeE